MRHLIAAEWLKLSKRPLTLILLAVFLVLFLVQFAGQVVFAGLLGRATQGSNLAMQAAEYRNRSVLPGAIGSAFGHINGLGGIFAIILTAAAIGSEYSWGTLRTQLARQPSRTRFLIAKIITVMLLLLVGTLICVVLAIGTGVVAGAFLPHAGTIGSVLFELPIALVRALYVLLPYVLLTFCFSVAGRSLLAGIVGGLTYLLLEGGFGALAIFAQLGGIWQALYNLTIGQNINTLVVLNNHAFGLRPELISPLATAALPPLWQSVLMIALYSVSFLTTTIWLFQRRDVGGAG
jgi:ABC-2 type transport system permease protein